MEECVHGSSSQDGFGSLFDEAGSSDGEGEETDYSALVEEMYTRRPADKSELVPPVLWLSLVSARHSLWGHRLWNAAILIADMLDAQEIDVVHKTVLELGAGAGLPGLVSAFAGARKVVISDYATSSDQTLMEPIRLNISRVQPHFVAMGTLHAVGHVWGQSVDDLLAPLTAPKATHLTGAASSPHGGSVCASGGPKDLSSHDREIHSLQASVEAPLVTESRQRVGDGGPDSGRGFDVIILADLLFNRSQHAQLLDSCDRCLSRAAGAAIWVSFSHHDPEKADLDMKFFDLAEAKGFLATRFRTVQREDLFVMNDGMDQLRGEVQLWRLMRADVDEREPSIVEEGFD